MKIVKFSINRPVTITMFMVAAVVFGYVAFDRLPINLLPDISYPTLTIRTEYAGTAPGEIENLISKPCVPGNEFPLTCGKGHCPPKFDDGID